MPETITIDQGTVFTGRKVTEFAAEIGFKLAISTPYNDQENGQVEATNKVIIGLIKKHVGQNPRSWHMTLGQALWACRNSPKESTNTTSFKLVNGHDAVLPLEVHLQPIRIQRQAEIPTEYYWGMMYDTLVDVEEHRLTSLDAILRLKEQVAKAYNRKVNVEAFNCGDLVWKVILTMDRRDRVLGKWSPNWEGPFQVCHTPNLPTRFQKIV
ncbi:uncharacterized protein LOC131613319 [Vicia villosa]|uniref:uncharacterized protein LOC131613319 n=1 Tax=Vicia villosa TaxID=3911 RepID=UPI00273A920F|nr:uncharacterized protein LOC131613319 [Vicia villosa]